MSDRFVSTARGRLHYLEKGDGDGMPLILLHSNGCSAHEYDDVVPGLARHFRVLSLDLPGHGDSDRITTHHAVGDYADGVIAFMNALGLSKSWVLGSSIGGFVVADLSRRYRARMPGVIVVEAALQSADEWAVQWPVVEAVFGQASQAFEQVAPRFRAFRQDQLARWNLDRAKAGVWTMLDVMWAIRGYDMDATLARPGSPIALIFGDRGPATPGIPRFVRALPDAPRRILTDCGHFPMIDDPAAFTTATLECLRSMGADA